MFLALREPSVVVFNKLRVAPPSSFATLESPAAPEGSCHNLREYGSERSSEPSGSVMCGNPQRRPSTSFEGLRLFHPSPSRCPKHPEALGHHLRTPDLDELFDASSSSVNLRVDASSSSVNLRPSFESHHLREGAIPNSNMLSSNLTFTCVDSSYIVQCPNVLYLHECRTWLFQF